MVKTKRSTQTVPVGAQAHVEKMVPKMSDGALSGVTLTLTHGDISYKIYLPQILINRYFKKWTALETETKKTIDKLNEVYNHFTRRFTKESPGIPRYSVFGTGRKPHPDEKDTAPPVPEKGGAHDPGAIGVRGRAPRRPRSWAPRRPRKKRVNRRPLI